MRPGQGEQALVHPEGLEEAAPLGGLGLLAHAGPDVGVHRVGPAHGLLRVVADLDRHPGSRQGPGAGHDRRRRLVAGGRGDPQAHPAHRPAEHQGVAHVVPVAQEGHGGPRQGPGLGHRLEVRQRLAGVLEVGEEIDDRSRGVLRHRHEVAVTEHPESKDVEVAVEGSGDVGHRLPLAQPHLVLLQHQGHRPQVHRGHLARHPGAGRGLLEEQADLPPGEAPGNAARLAFTVAALASTSARPAAPRSVTLRKSMLSLLGAARRARRRLPR